MFTLDFQRSDALTLEDLLPNIPISGSELRPRSCASVRLFAAASCISDAVP